jgi:hypothetical protein
MRDVLLRVWICLGCVMAGCTADPVMGTANPVLLDPGAFGMITPKPYLTCRVRCNANYGQFCSLTSPGCGVPDWPPGAVHCKTVLSKQNIPPTRGAGSSWGVVGRNVLYVATACPGPAWDKWGSSVDVEWSTYLVGEDHLNDPGNGCLPDVKGDVGVVTAVCSP